MTALGLHPHTSFGGLRPRFAGTPAEFRAGARDAARLLVCRPGALSHRRFGDLVEEFRPGDVLVVNISATVNGETDGIWRSRDGTVPVVAHLAGPLDGGGWVLEIRTAPDAARPVLDARPGDEVVAAGLGVLRIRAPYPEPGSPTGAGNRLWRADCECDVRAGLDVSGRPVAYGYLDRRWPLSAYQTVFSRVPGSAEMASAGRPFTAELVLSLIARGVVVAPVVLHTGFSSQEAGEPPQPERFDVPEQTAVLVNAARARGHRVVAVGTTATRALESAVVGGRAVASSGWTRRVVTPEDPPRIVDGLITGWHDEDASHLLLVEAVAGGQLAQEAYAAALAEHYVWHEFGDSGLFLPGAG